LDNGVPWLWSFVVSSAPGAGEHIATHPRAARDSNETFFFVWEADSDGDGWKEIHGQSTTAHSLGGPTIQISSPTGSDHIRPAVALDDSGNAVVVWTGVGPHSTTAEVWGQAIDASTGSLVGPAVQLLSGSGFDYLNPRIGSSPGGEFTLAWVQKDQASDVATIQTQRFTGLLSALDEPQQVNTTEFQTYLLEDVVVDDAGIATVFWEGREFERGRGWYSQSFGGGTGQRLGGETLVSPAYEP
jgi:hypothetical protein